MILLCPHCRSAPEPLDVALIAIPTEDGAWLCPLCGETCEAPEPSFADWRRGWEDFDEALVARHFGLEHTGGGGLGQGEDRFWDGHEAPERRRR